VFILQRPQQTAPFVASVIGFPWLTTNIAGGSWRAFLSGIFEAELQQVVALALFIPVVLATVGEREHPVGQPWRSNRYTGNTRRSKEYSAGAF